MRRYWSAWALHWLMDAGASRVKRRRRITLTCLLQLMSIAPSSPSASRGSSRKPQSGAPAQKIIWSRNRAAPNNQSSSYRCKMLELKAAAWYVSTFDKVCTEVQNSQCICQKICLIFRDINCVRQRGKRVTSQRLADGKRWSFRGKKKVSTLLRTEWKRLQKSLQGDSEVWCFQRKWPRDSAAGRRPSPESWWTPHRYHWHQCGEKPDHETMQKCSKVCFCLHGCWTEFINSPARNFSPPCFNPSTGSIETDSYLYQHRRFAVLIKTNNILKNTTIVLDNEEIQTLDNDVHLQL